MTENFLCSSLYYICCISFFVFITNTHLHAHIWMQNTMVTINDCTAKLDLDRTCCFTKRQFLILLSNYQDLLWQKQQDLLFIFCVSIMKLSPIKQQTALHTLQDHAAVSSCSAIFLCFIIRFCLYTSFLYTKSFFNLSFLRGLLVH